MSAIHQLVAGFTHHDAISIEARNLRALFRSWGYESEIFSEQKRILPELRKEVKDVYACKRTAGPDDVVLLHLSTGSIVNKVFKDLPGKKAILYHNITPWSFFAGINEQIARHLKQGREQMAQLSGAAEAVMAHSAFSAHELKEAGYRDVQVLPFIVDFQGLEKTPHPRVMQKMNDGKKNILFVGRGAPNKCIEDLGHAFYYFQNFVEPNSRLIWVGSSSGMEAYHALLLSRYSAMYLDEVSFTGPVEADELAAYYRTADLFLCMSEHEGFCVPLVEAMAFDVPVLAYEAGAVPETLGGAGVLFREKQWDRIAEMMGRLTGDESLRRQVLAGQRKRLDEIKGNSRDEGIRQCLEPLLK